MTLLTFGLPQSQIDAMLNVAPLHDNSAVVAIRGDKIAQIERALDKASPMSRQQLCKALDVKSRTMWQWIEYGIQAGRIREVFRGAHGIVFYERCKNGLD